MDDERLALAHAKGLNAALEHFDLPFDEDIPSATNLQSRVWVAVINSDRARVPQRRQLCRTKTECMQIIGDHLSLNACWASFPSMSEAKVWQAAFWNEYWVHC